MRRIARVIKLSPLVNITENKTFDQLILDFLARARAPYITKPFEAEQIKKEINHILSQQV